MKLYRIADWAKHFENNRSKAVENTRWVPMPNRHDGENFTRIMRSKQGAQVYAAWVLMVQVASKCEPRGTLVKGSGIPHDPVSLSLKTGAPELWFVTALDFLEKETDWLVVEEVAGGRQAGVTSTSGGCQAPDVQLPRKKEGMEEKGMERMEPPAASPWLVAFDLILPEALQTQPCFEAIMRWLRYKAERKETYKRIGLEAALSKWSKEFTAKSFPVSVENSIAANWAGLFQPRDETVRNGNVQYGNRIDGQPVRKDWKQMTDEEILREAL
jgi:hypothetical protein